MEVNICRHTEKSEFKKMGRAVLYQCRGCRLIFTLDIQKKVIPKVLYETYYNNETGGRFSFGIEYIIRGFRFFRAFKIFSLCPRGKSILDIGSGRGFMLYYLKKFFGFETAIGIQPSLPAFNFSKNRLGLKVFDQDFLEIDFSPSSFDVITLWHVLEHVSSPDAYIKKISNCLKSRGKLIIEVPNLNSWTAWFTGEYWLGLDLKYHLFFFTPDILREVLRRNDFVIKNVHTFSLEYSTFISAQSIVSFLTRSDHCIFEWIQSKKFSTILIFHCILFAIFLPICFVINIILFFSKKGEVLLVMAEKK